MSARRASRPAAGPATVELHIERLALHGFTPLERERITAAIEAEFGHLVASGGVPPGLAAGSAHGRGPALRMTRGGGDTPEAVGHRVAAALYQEMGGPAEGRGRTGT